MVFFNIFIRWDQDRKENRVSIELLETHAVFYTPNSSLIKLKGHNIHVTGSSTKQTNRTSMYACIFNNELNFKIDKTIDKQINTMYMNKSEGNTRKRKLGNQAATVTEAY